MCFKFQSALWKVQLGFFSLFVSILAILNFFYEITPDFKLNEWWTHNGRSLFIFILFWMSIVSTLFGAKTNELYNFFILFSLLEWLEQTILDLVWWNWNVYARRYKTWGGKFTAVRSSPLKICELTSVWEVFSRHCEIGIYVGWYILQIQYLSEVYKFCIQFVWKFLKFCIEKELNLNFLFVNFFN